MKKRMPYHYKTDGQVFMIPVGDIRPNPAQPRKEFPLDGLVELAQSISENGILQPLTVTMGSDGPILIAGERRLRAARIAGLSVVPCVEKTVDEHQRQVLALVENLQRQNMNCFEVAEGIRQLMNNGGLTQWEAAQQLGYSSSAVANKLRLLKLTEEERRRLTEAGMTERHARALLRLDKPEQRRDILNKLTEKRLTVAQTERLVESVIHQKEKKNTRLLVKDVRVFFNTVNHALDLMRKGGIAAQSTKRENEDYIEYVVKIPKSTATTTS